MVTPKITCVKKKRNATGEILVINTQVSLTDQVRSTWFRGPIEADNNPEFSRLPTETQQFIQKLLGITGIQRAKLSRRNEVTVQISRNFVEANLARIY